MLPALQPSSPRGTLHNRNISPASVVLLKRNLNQTGSSSAQTAPPSLSKPKGIFMSSSDSTNFSSPRKLGIAPRSILKRPTLSRPQSDNIMSNVLGCMSASDLNARSNDNIAKAGAVAEAGQDAHNESQVVHTGLDLTSPRSDFARSDGQSESGASYATAASEPDNTRELVEWASKLHLSLALDNAIHAITTTYQPTKSTANAPKKDDTTLGDCAIIYRADHFNSYGTGQPSEQMDFTGLTQNILSGIRQERANKYARRFSAKPGPKEAMFLEQPSSYVILPVFDESSDTLCWWSVAIDPPHAGFEQNKLEQRHRETEAYNLNVNSASLAWWDVPPGLSVLARTVARKRKDSTASIESLPARVNIVSATVLLVHTIP